MAVASSVGRPPGGASTAQLAEPVLDAPLGDPDQRLAHDVTAHLGLAVHALDERDRHLDDAEAGVDGPARQVDLEAVALRRDGGQVDALERRTPEGAIAAGGVVQPAGRARAARRCSRRASSHSRRFGQFTTRPPGTQRAPSTRSAPGSASSSRGSCSGRWEPSASISTSTS